MFVLLIVILGARDTFLCSEFLTHAERLTEYGTERAGSNSVGTNQQPSELYVINLRCPSV